MSSTYAPCSSCGKLNRVDLSESASKEPICGACKATLPVHFGVAEIGFKGLQTLSTTSPLPVIVDFWAAWCGPCKAFAPTFQQASTRFAGRAVFAKLNTETEPQASAAFQIRSIPTLILFSGGKESARLNGALGLEDFSTWLNEHLK